MRKAIVCHGEIVIEEAQEPSLSGQQGAIVRVKLCGLCGSDIVKYLNGGDEVVLGHEVVGEIIEINSDTYFKTGDEIVMGHHVPCFGCVYCQNANYSMCEQFKSTNIFPCGFSEKIFVSELHLKNTVFKKPDELSPEEASFMEPLACCVRAVERAGLAANSRILVVGLGSIGLLMGQALKACGHEIIGSDLIVARLDLASSVGFDAAVEFGDMGTTANAVRDLTQGLGVDAVFMTSGAAGALSFALKAVRDGGTIVVFSSIKIEDGYSNNDIYYRELKILGSYSPSPADLKKSLEMLASKKVVVKNFSTAYNLSQLEQAIADTMQNKILKAYITL